MTRRSLMLKHSYDFVMGIYPFFRTYLHPCFPEIVEHQTRKACMHHIQLPPSPNSQRPIYATGSPPPATGCSPPAPQPLVPKAALGGNSNRFGKLPTQPVVLLQYTLETVGSSTSLSFTKKQKKSINFSHRSTKTSVRWLFFFKWYSSGRQSLQLFPSPEHTPNGGQSVVCHIGDHPLPFDACSKPRNVTPFQCRHDPREISPQRDNAVSAHAALVGHCLYFGVSIFSVLI